jgi:hypothetical protein
MTRTEALGDLLLGFKGQVGMDQNDSTLRT